MYASNVLAVSGALIAAVAAIPMAGEHHHQHHAREIVWKTAIDEVVVTIPVTKTIWVEPGETPPTNPESYAASSSTPDVQPAAYQPSPPVAPAPAYTPETSTSVYVAPAPAYTPESSSPVYVAPAYTPESSSSVYVAPTPSSTPVYVAPAPESTYVAPATYVAPSPSSTYAAPVASSSPVSYSGGSDDGLGYGMGATGTAYTGELTYFAPGLGACGHTSTDADQMVAVSHVIFDSYGVANPNLNPLCGMTVNIKGTDGTTYQAQIWDRCPGCDTADLDLPEPFFNKVTMNPETRSPADGRAYDMDWNFA